MCNKNNQDPNSIADILKVILVLQQNACPDSCLDTCDRPMLGGGTSCLVCYALYKLWQFGSLEYAYY